MLLSLLVGTLTGLILAVLGVDLWLVFGALAFWLNFVPNLGACVATLLPLPVVCFDPNFSTLDSLLAFVLPASVHMTVGNVLEPVIFGRSMALHPVVVLLALMFWGALWGVTGVVIAVPLTAVARIHLSHIDHPLPRYLASVLVGSRAARLRAGVVPAPAVAPERVPLVSQQASGDHDDDQNFP